MIVVPGLDNIDVANKHYNVIDDFDHDEHKLMMYVLQYKMIELNLPSSNFDA